MSDSASLLSLFVGSFLAATLLPGGSEAVLFGVLNAYPETFWNALIVATAGNTLGGMVTFGMGWLLPMTQQLKHVEKMRHYGAPILLLAWAPLLGDALCLAAGWLRLSPWQAALYMAIRKIRALLGDCERNHLTACLRGLRTCALLPHHGITRLVVFLFLPPSAR